MFPYKTKTDGFSYPPSRKAVTRLRIRILRSAGKRLQCPQHPCRTGVLANNARFGPTIEVTLPDESKEACFNDNFKVRAYLECYTNSRDNTECCKGAGIPGDDEPADPERKGCLALCDGTHDLPGSIKQAVNRR